MTSFRVVGLPNYDLFQEDFWDISARELVPQ